MTIEWIPDLKKGDTPLYLAITKALGDDISSGKLPIDSRLPAQRELADRLNVALGTITRAYIEAEKRGLIRSEGRRGTFVGEAKADRSILSKLIDTESHIINFSHNHPNYGDDPDLSVALKKIARRAGIQKLLHYAPSAGFPHHREAGAKWLMSLGLKVNPDSIIITAGAQHALTVAFAAIAERNDFILTDLYTYPGMKAVAELYGLNLIGVPQDDEGMIPDHIESLCSQKNVRAVYLNPTFQNPTAIIYSQKRRQEIASLAEKHDFLIIEDELLRPLISNPPQFVSSFAPERSLAIMSASKTIAAGLRIGFMKVPVRFRQRVIDSLQTSMLNVPALMAELLTSWLEDGTSDKIIEKRRQEIACRQELSRSILRGYSLSTDQESPHMWLYLPEPWTGNEFTIEAYRRGVAITPAEIFAVDKNAPSNALRLSLANEPTRGSLRKGLQIIASILEGTPLQDSATV
jgi:DNA-binding transcriptional MocR family regulator